MNRGNQLLIAVLVVVLVVILAIAVQPLVDDVGSSSLVSDVYGGGINTSAVGAVLMESSTQRVLWQHNAHQSMPMASTTKVLTALAVLQHCNIHDVVTVDSRAVGVEGSSIYLKEGDMLTVYHLLCGLMLRSGNDSAVALAIHCSGSVENFAQCVNDMCLQWGLQDTHVVNPHGLHDDNHYTSAYDLAVVSCIAQNNDTFREIVSSKSSTLHYMNNNTDVTIYNKNKLLSSYDGADGVKTGYTKVAGKCYVGSATRQGMQLVSVVLNDYNMWQDSQTMLDYGFNNYTMTNIVSQNAQFRLDMQGDSQVWCCKDGYSYPIANNNSDSVSIDIGGSYSQPLVNVTVNGNMVDSAPLYKVS